MDETCCACPLLACVLRCGNKENRDRDSRAVSVDREHACSGRVAKGWRGRPLGMNPPATTEPTQRTANIIGGIVALIVLVAVWGWATKGDAPKDIVAERSPTAAQPPRAEPAAEPEPAEPKPELAIAIKIKASSLWANYEANEVRADETFKGKRLEVSGKIETIGKDILGDPYLTLATGQEFAGGGVQAFFEGDATKQVSGPQATGSVVEPVLVLLSPVVVVGSSGSSVAEVDVPTEVVGTTSVVLVVGSGAALAVLGAGAGAASEVTHTGSMGHAERRAARVTSSGVLKSIRVRA